MSIIYKVKFNRNEKEKAFEFKRENMLGKGIQEIINILKGINVEFIDNENDFFYEIVTNIKFLDEMKIDIKLKKTICFIDLPGFGTKNQFDNKNIYENLVQCSNYFLFIFRNLIIKDNSNHKMLSNLLSTMSMYSGTTERGFANRCLFLINYEGGIKDFLSEKSDEQMKKDIIEVLNCGISKEIINSSYFNAKYYENYLLDLNNFEYPELFIKDEYINYCDKIENIYKGLEYNKKIINDFLKYLKDYFKSKMQTIEKRS